jgi:4'-phosphopantetheinyl transferase
MSGGTGIAGLHVVSILHEQSQTRSGAREQIRQALREMVAGVLKLDVARVAIDAVPGSAPRLLVDGAPVAAGISLAHDGWISVAAWYEHGAVGVDVMQVQATADWYNVARDYLGPQALDALVCTRESGRALAFAQAWTAREAHLKCLGLALAEWTALPAVARTEEITVPAGYVAMVALETTVPHPTSPAA